MVRQSITLPRQEPETHPSRCGCTHGEESCCHLDCLVQPRFFCGQLLTDQDLKALLDWTHQKSRLGRYRHGWGVVCGLEVRCDAGQTGRVIVGPGYAVSCCGDDIIVCEETPFDLGDACRDEKDPCAELRRPEATTGQPETVAFASLTLASNEVRVIDLYIRYREELAAPQTALGRSVCREVAECEYSRTREVSTLSWQPAAIGSNPVEAEARRWHEAYEKCLEVITSFRARFADLSGQGEEVRRWLLRWIDTHPLHQFCFVHDWICEMSADDLINQENLARVLFWLVQDCRNAFLTCGCYGCQESPGVPLARIWLHATTGPQGRRRCKILGIDAYAPYRRLLSQSCWPAPLGQANLGQVIWHLWDDDRGREAWTRLADLGVRVDATADFTIPNNVAALETALTGDLFVPYGEGRIVQRFQAAGLGQRVVGFSMPAL